MSLLLRTVHYDSLASCASGCTPFDCSGYCFDGKTVCFSPTPVLAALHDGRVTETSMIVFPSLNSESAWQWLGMRPADVVDKVAAEALLQKNVTVPADVCHPVPVVDIRQKKVHATALLLHAGLLTHVQPASAPREQN